MTKKNGGGFERLKPYAEVQADALEDMECKGGYLIPDSLREAVARAKRPAPIDVFGSLCLNDEREEKP